MVATFSKVLITPKQLHLEHFCKYDVKLLSPCLQDGTIFRGLSL